MINKILKDIDKEECYYVGTNGCLYQDLGKEELLAIKQEIERLNNIIKELDDYIDKNTEYNHDGDDYGYMEWYDIINVDTTTFINDINEILRKSDKE